jgi:transcriptional regulator with XRE-family HTH domain
MREKSWFEKMLDSVKESFAFRLETTILHLTEQICERMKQKNITRKQLAENLSVSPPAITKILNGNSNFTLRTLLTIADALDLDLTVNFRPKDISAEAQMGSVIHVTMADCTYHGPITTGLYRMPALHSTTNVYATASVEPFFIGRRPEEPQGLQAA